MNLSKLFEMQRQLDDHIMDEHPELKGQDNLDWKILALQVELGECANEWRGFKKWKKNRDPRTAAICEHCSGKGKGFFSGKQYTGYREICVVCDGTGFNKNKNPLLEEYVDCLHFILSIGLENAEQYGEMVPIYFRFNSLEPIKYENITKQFNYMFNQIGYFMDCCCDHEWGTDGEIEEQYEFLFRMFIGLGEILGFTWNEIEQAYFDKNKINHQRQEDGY